MAMLRKPHTYIALLIAGLIGFYSYAWVKGSTTSPKVAFQIKKEQDRPLSFDLISVSQHEDQVDTSLSALPHKDRASHPTSLQKNKPSSPPQEMPLQQPPKAEDAPSSSNTTSRSEGVREVELESPQKDDESASLQGQQSEEEPLKEQKDLASRESEEQPKTPASSEGENATPFLEKMNEGLAPASLEKAPDSSGPDRQEQGDTSESEASLSAENPKPSHTNAAQGVVPQDPQIILVVEGLGRRQETLELALDLPDGVTLAFHSFEGVEGISSKVRDDGHEVLLMLPLEPLDYPDNDPGPMSLLTGLEEGENQHRLRAHLANLPSCRGVVPFLGSRFLVSQKDLLPVMKALKEKGLYFVETLQTPKSVAHKVANSQSLPFQRIENRLDQTVTQEAVLRELSLLEEEAQKEGQAIAVTEDIPLILQLVASWAQTLPDKKIRLVPLSASFGQRDQASS